MTLLKVWLHTALGCNHQSFACPSYSLHVQLLWYPMYYPGGMKARVSPVQWSKPHSILAPTRDSNPGCRIQNHKRWPLHYHCTPEFQIASIYVMYVIIITIYLENVYFFHVDQAILCCHLHILAKSSLSLHFTPVTSRFLLVDSQSSALLRSRYPNHLNLPCLTQSASHWIPKRLYKSLSIFQLTLHIHLTIIHSVLSRLRMHEAV